MPTVGSSHTLWCGLPDDGDWLPGLGPGGGLLTTLLTFLQIQSKSMMTHTHTHTHTHAHTHTHTHTHKRQLTVHLAVQQPTRTINTTPQTGPCRWAGDSGEGPSFPPHNTLNAHAYSAPVRVLLLCVHEAANDGQVDADEVHPREHVVAAEAQDGKIRSQHVLQAAHDGRRECGVDLQGHRKAVLPRHALP